MVNLLVIDDDKPSLDLVTAALEQEGLRILTASDPIAGLEIMRRVHPSIVIVDLMMPTLNGLEVLDRIMTTDPATDVILMTAHYSTETAVEAIQKGACDYLNKPIDVDRLCERIEPLVNAARDRERARKLDDQMVGAYSFQGMIGRSPLMLDVYARIRRIAPHFQSVLVTGPTGTGKELVAHALHQLSPTPNGPFAVANCAALSENLVESELFGHVRGAFTGAVQDKAGLFEHAHGGTLFLDEIGDMPLPAQAKLLRAIQHKEIQRVGSPAVKKVNVRVIAAANRNLRAMIAQKQFREDLFFRLAMVEIGLPSLAERREDLPLLLRHFVAQFNAQFRKNIEGVTRRAETRLYRHHWPGNVRELENVIGYAAMMTESTQIDIRDLPEALLSAEPREGSHPMVTMDEMQKLHAARVLEHCNGDKQQAAEILGVSRATLYRALSGAESKIVE